MFLSVKGVKLKNNLDYLRNITERLCKSPMERNEINKKICEEINSVITLLEDGKTEEVKVKLKKIAQSLETKNE